MSRAAAKVRILIDWVKTYDKLEQDHSESGDFEASLAKMNLDPVQHLIEVPPKTDGERVLAVYDAYDKLTSAADFDELAGAVDKCIETFVHFWNERDDYADVAWRELPCCPGCEQLPHVVQRIVITTGDITWGDTPDNPGYVLLTQAFTLGITPIFGIE